MSGGFELSATSSLITAGQKNDEFQLEASPVFTWALIGSHPSLGRSRNFSNMSHPETTDSKVPLRTQKYWQTEEL
jgi:hypothetical protein